MINLDTLNQLSPITDIRTLRQKIKQPSEIIRNQIIKIYKDLSFDDKLLIFENLAMVGKICWLMEPDISDQDHETFHNIIRHLEKYNKSQIFGFMISSSYLLLLPSNSEEQLLQELKKRILLL